MSLLRGIWTMLTARQRFWVVSAQLLSILMAFSTVAGIASIAPLFNVLANPAAITQNRWLHALYSYCGFTEPRAFEIALGLAFVTLVLVANLINLLGTLVMARIAWRIGTDFQATLFAEYLTRPYVFHANTNSAVLFSNIIHEASRATVDILHNVFVVVTSIVTATLIVVSVMALNLTVAAAGVAALAGGYVLIYLIVRNGLIRAGRVQSHFFIEQTRVVNEGFGAIKEVIVLRAQNFLRGRFEHASHEYARSVTYTQLMAQSPRHVMEFVAVGGLVLAALLASGDGTGIGPQLGSLTFLGFAAYRLLPTLQQAFGAIVRIRTARAGFAVIAADLHLARAVRPATAAIDACWLERPCGEIRLRNVSFAYATRQSPAIRDVSMCISARSAVGFVGGNGSGKTTLVDLICGLLVPDTGDLEVDGVIVDDAQRASWQSRIAYVPQNIYLLDTTVAQNIALGVPASSIDQRRLRMAARLAQLDDFVSTLPDGYDHVIGERGLRLSGGQRQRVGIARALYSAAPVLILDEATSALDGLTEKELMTTLLALRGRYTIIVIAHQLSAVRSCDVIFEFADGRLTGSGTFEELLRESSSFQGLKAL